jgi:isochorismate synthase EntC
LPAGDFERVTKESLAIASNKRSTIVLNRYIEQKWPSHIHLIHLLMQDICAKITSKTAYTFADTSDTSSSFVGASTHETVSPSEESSFEARYKRT